jgi:hypothetical protein
MSGATTADLSGVIEAILAGKGLLYAAEVHCMFEAFADKIGLIYWCVADVGIAAWRLKYHGIDRCYQMIRLGRQSF